MGQMEFKILGPLEVVGSDGPIAIDAGKVSALLELLLLRANEVISAERLVDTLWGEAPPGSAEHAIEVYISRLRRALGADRIETRSPGYRVRVGAGELDLHRFEALTAEAHKSLDASDPAAAVRLFRQAEALWRGPALADLRSSDRTRAEITRLDELRLAETEARIDAMHATGQHAELIPELEGLVAEHPFRERLLAQFMLALYRSGRQVEALEAYQTARRALDEDLGLEPGPALQQLQMAILRQDPALDAAGWPRPGSGTAKGQAAAASTPAPPAARRSARHVRPRVALAGFVFLVVVGVVMFQLVGGGTGSALPTSGTVSDSGANQSSSPDSSIVLTLADQELSDQLPGAVGNDCRPASVAEGAVGDAASLRCLLPPIAEAEEVWFDRFSTLDSLNVNFGDLVQRSGASAGNCATTPEAVQPWTVPDVHEGMLLCYSTEDASWVVWSYDADKILARASRRGNDWLALYTWWRETANFLR